MLCFIIGVLFMSLCASIGALLLDKGYDFAFLLMGPIAWIILIVALIYNILSHYLRYHNVRSLLVCPDGEIRYIKHELVDVMRNCNDRDYEFPNFKEHAEWDTDEWDKRFVCLGRGNMRYVPKKIWNEYDPISKEEIEYAKNNPYSDMEE